jgi:hypothetical protein
VAKDIDYRALADAAIHLATQSLVREASLRGVLAKRGIVTNQEVDAYRQENAVLIAAEVRQLLVRDLEAAIGATKAGEADALVEAAAKSRFPTVPETRPSPKSKKS